MSNENTTTVVDNEKGLTFRLIECGKDSKYAGFKIWVKEANTLEAAAKDSGAQSVLNGYNSAASAAQQQRAKNALCDGIDQRQGESDGDYLNRCIAEARARGVVEINSREQAAAYTYGSSKLSMPTITRNFEKIKSEIKAMKADPSVDVNALAAKIEEAKRLKAQLQAYANSEF